MMELDPSVYTVAWIAPLNIEAKAARLLLDKEHDGQFPMHRGDDYVFLAGEMCGHNIIIATLPAGQEYGTGSAAALASQVRKHFPNLWFGLLVGIGAGLPRFNGNSPRDIRLGDVLVAQGDSEHAGLVAYGLGKETPNGFEPLLHGHSLAKTEIVVMSAIARIKLDSPSEIDRFSKFYKTIQQSRHGKLFDDPGQEKDKLHDREGFEVLRDLRPPEARTSVWYGSIGSGDKLMKNAAKRDELQNRYDFIGLEMEAAGAINRIPVGVIRGVSDYADQYKNDEWHGYAAAMAAAFAKAVLALIYVKKNVHDGGQGQKVPSDRRVKDSQPSERSPSPQPAPSSSQVHGSLDSSPVPPNQQMRPLPPPSTSLDTPETPSWPCLMGTFIIGTASLVITVYEFAITRYISAASRNGGSAERWRILRINEHECGIESVVNDYWLTAPEDLSNCRVKLTRLDPTRNSRSRWKISTNGKGSKGVLLFNSAFPSMFLTLGDHSSLFFGTPIELNVLTGRANQLWKLESV